MSEEQKLPKTLIEAIRYFSDSDNCHDFMVSMRWADGVKCPHCDSAKVGKFSGKRRVSNCKECKKQFTVKVGTIFEDSAISLSKWLPAVWMIVNAKNGVSSCELSRSLGVTQKTAWFMAHRIRLALEYGTFQKLGGTVEIDESYIGGKARNMHKSTKVRRGIVGTGGVGKTAIMGLLSRHTDKKTASRVIAEVIGSVPNRRLTNEKARKYVLKEAEINTDAGSHFMDLKNEYVHKVVDHAECYVKDNVHTNGLENFWSLLKRSINGTYVSCAPFHLHRYLGEQVYRFNERKTDDATRFSMAVSGTAGKRITYDKLIGQASA